jgi:uroporphyrinogen III methyltransferase/synthase
MGVKSLGRIGQKLIAHGLSPDTPAATIQWGTTPRQRTVVATIATIADAVRAAGVGSPAITVVGKVVQLRDTIGWFESRPLFGRTIAVTRTRQQASDLSDQLAALGANVIEAPTIDIVPPESWDDVDEALRSLASADWAVFTSASGVEAARERLAAIGLDARAFGGAKVAAIGAATAEAVRQKLCLKVDIVPERAVAEALSDALRDAGEIAGKKFVLLRAEIGRPILIERLTSGGAAGVRDVAIYRTARPATLPAELTSALDEGAVDWITFTSSSTAQNLCDLLGPTYKDRIGHAKRASIGPVTSATLQQLGIPATAEAKDASVESLVDAIARM